MEERALPVARALVAEFDAVVVADSSGPVDADRDAAAAAAADDDFFKEGHRRVQAAFAKRWNWDVVQDCPMEGAWRWELVKRPSGATTA